jgi:hypothetical protein
MYSKYLDVVVPVLIFLPSFLQLRWLSTKPGNFCFPVLYNTIHLIHVLCLTLLLFLNFTSSSFCIIIPPVMYHHHHQASGL